VLNIILHYENSKAVHTLLQIIIHYKPRLDDFIFRSLKQNIFFAKIFIKFGTSFSIKSMIYINAPFRLSVRSMIILVIMSWSEQHVIF
jgi:hypothetical protein